MGEPEYDETLQQSLERYRNLSAAAFDGIGISQGGKIVDANEQLAALLGCERQDLIGNDVMSFVAPESRERVASAMRSADNQPYEHLALRKDGSVVRVEVRGRIVHYRGREARVTVVRDVSEQRRLEQALRSIVEGTVVVGEEFFPALVRGVATALGVRYALIGELVAERGAPRARGRRVRSLAFWGDGRALDPIEHALEGTACEKVITQGTCFYPEGARDHFPMDELLGRLGVEGYLGVPFFSASGEPLGVLLALHDQPLEQRGPARSILSIFAGRAAAEIERLRSEAAHRRSEESLRATIDATPHVAIQWYDADGRVLLWNRASEQIFGYTAAEALDKTLDQLILDAAEGRSFTERIRTILSSAVASGPTEYRFRRRDGSHGYCLSTLFRIPGGEDERGRVACMDIDISDQRSAEKQRTELEAQLRHAQQLEALGTLAGGIAHDFNNILASIFAYGELAGMEADDPKEVREHLSELHKAATRARDLVQQILVFSRRQTQPHRPIQLQQVVREVLKFMRSTLPATIEIDTALGSNVPLVLASSIQMHQVLLNLCMNAAHAMGRGPGRLRVVLDVVPIEPSAGSSFPELTPGRHVCMLVSDTGHGMDTKTLERIFEPFFTTKPAGEGTGLGLAVVHGIVRDHRGAVRVQSEPGRGSTFRVYLPAAAGAAARDVARHNLAPAGKGERVLFVDDESALCHASRAVLERIGYRVATHTDPVSALEDFSRAPYDFDIVVTDLSMPHMLGTELARRLLALRPGLPVLLVSGFAGGVDAAELDSLGLRDFLPKPFYPSALAAAVRKTLDTSI